MLRIGRVLVNFHSLCTEGYASLHQLVDIDFAAGPLIPSAAAEEPT